MITYDDFLKLKIRIGKVLTAQRVEGADRLIQFEFDFGNEKRQVVSGIAETYPDPDALIGMEMPVIVNLEPRIIRGVESHGMIMAAEAEDGRYVFLQPEQQVPPGSRVQ